MPKTTFSSRHDLRAKRRNRKTKDQNEVHNIKSEDSYPDVLDGNFNWKDSGMHDADSVTSRPSSQCNVIIICSFHYNFVIMMNIKQG